MDLNLLRVFDALLETGSVSAAAGRLHLSVPATSRALGRLRQAMNDPIMVRAGRGLVPTPFAQRSRAQVRALLDAAAALRAAPDDSPATWRRTFSIRINDGLAPVLSSRLTGRIAAEAPGVTVRFVAQQSKDPEPLRDGTLDLDIGVADPPPPDVRSRTLFSDHVVALVAADSRLGRAGEITLDDLVRYPHISASRRGLTRGPIDDQLAQHGLSRRVTAVVPNYAVAALLALEPDVISLAPRVLAEHLTARGMPLRWHEFPLTLPEVDVNLRWHQRLDEDVPSRWLRDQVRAASAQAAQ
ncbi:LysR family transcriptional regulator [Actinoplanes sp. TRM 88003]|uniref:LysR family transcriptional regulator n=1 Tax=Paractinoplanes aksuensis TaxID=2939490 RepID=A0ABT1DU72_9ACTN|nr:LysR family transcriptional regulator [Actinoplanes aksuensis]MCO8274400.1 LysR family transcriptional regulator [Actinoplanes aksuensis]